MAMVIVGVGVGEGGWRGLPDWRSRRRAVTALRRWAATVRRRFTVGAGLWVVSVDEEMCVLWLMMMERGGGGWYVVDDEMWLLSVCMGQVVTVFRRLPALRR